MTGFVILGEPPNFDVHDVLEMGDDVALYDMVTFDQTGPGRVVMRVVKPREYADFEGRMYQINKGESDDTFQLREVRMSFCPRPESTSYSRPSPKVKLTKKQKLEALSQYFEFYRCLAKQSPALLNVKVRREDYDDLLNQIGNLLLTSSEKAAAESGPVRDFLGVNKLPDALKGLLPDEFRAFCLSLNALKQWVSAEQAATDRYFLGGTAREMCRQVASACVLTDESFDGKVVELHHPVRDGRPPIPLSKTGHAQIEGQLPGQSADPHLEAIRALKRDGKRSWAQLRLGCRALLGQTVSGANVSALSSAKTFARKAAELTGMNNQQLIEWLDSNGF
jgi:hypothetical protein